MDSETGDKRHAPTEHRLKKAAENGDVVRSPELPRAVAIILVIASGFGLFSSLAHALFGDCAIWLGEAGQADLKAPISWGASYFYLLIPVIGIIGAASFVSSICVGGWIFSLSFVKFDLAHVGLGQGISRLISFKHMIDVSKSGLTFLSIGIVSYFCFLHNLRSFIALALIKRPNADAVFGVIVKVLIPIALVVCFVALVDVFIQYRSHRHKLRMTDDDIRQEMKEVAGNPHVKSKQRMIARKLARARQMTKVGEASVVVVNPTHYACAVRYRRGTDGAPLLLAKGLGLLAEEIVAKARGYGIPVVEAPPLARAIYRYVEPGDHIPVPLYRACAEVLAYVWRLQRWRAHGGTKPKPMKMLADELVSRSVNGLHSG